jgi:membrane protein implicated in regulation of membrane protease activity
MQWLFLVLALSAALAELHTGTFYLAAVAAVALMTAALGIWIDDEHLIVTFAIGCVAACALVWLYHRTAARKPAFADFDAGQDVTVEAVNPGENRLTVSYRGTRWDAVLDHGPPPSIGARVRITRKTGSILHVAPHHSVQEAS